MATSLGHLPGQRWAFDESVTHVFDDMLERSIPQYHEMRRLCFDVGSLFVQPQTEIVDLGCSRGEALVPFMERYGANNRYLGLDVSEPMLDAARQRFASWPESIVRIRSFDLRTGFPSCDASLILSALTLMFIPINYRQRIVQDAYDALRPDGALIVVEKVLGSSAQTDRLMVNRYHRMKAENGYSSGEIERKRLALEGVQVPVTAAWNEDLLHAAGFRRVECFWRWMNFAAWVGVK
jgi:tRNA (cmo5U34)-methyltransferase